MVVVSATPLSRRALRATFRLRRMDRIALAPAAIPAPTVGPGSVMKPSAAAVIDDSRIGHDDSSGISTIGYNTTCDCEACSDQKTA